MYPLAALVFCASIVVPVLKLIALGAMLVATGLGSPRRLRDRTRAYRIVAAIGRWSMIDVFMASILVALVHFGGLVNISSGFGAVAFASVVILTMLAAEAFDPRLMWDAAARARGGGEMSSCACSPEASLRAKVDLRPRLSPIWLVPIIAVLIGGWLVWDAMAKRGPLVTVTFQSAEGLQAGQSHLRHLDVDLGLVERIALNPDMAGVTVSIRTTREAEPLLTENAQFWVVRPRLFAGSLSGLGTLVSGSYIEVMRSVEGGRQQLSFTGLEDPPVLEAHVPGRTVQLQANRIGSISVGSPVFFRDLNVGQVLGWDLGKMAESVTIHAFIRAPFDQYVRASSRFWNASGISVQLGAEGVQLQLESLKALLLGGIAFDSPEDGRVAAGAAAPDEPLPSIPASRWRRTSPIAASVKVLAYFEGSVSGLGVGRAGDLPGPQGRPGDECRAGIRPGQRHDPRARAVRDAARADRRRAAVREARPGGECADAGGAWHAGAAAERQPAYRSDAGRAGDDPGRGTGRVAGRGRRAGAARPCRGRSPAPWPRRRRCWRSWRSCRSTAWARASKPPSRASTRSSTGPSSSSRLPRCRRPWRARRS